MKKSDRELLEYTIKLCAIVILILAGYSSCVGMI